MHYVPYALEEDMDGKGGAVRTTSHHHGGNAMVDVPMDTFRRLGAPGELRFGTVRESVYLHPLPYISISRISLPRLEHCACSQPRTVCVPLSRITTCPSP